MGGNSELSHYLEYIKAQCSHFHQPTEFNGH